MFGHWTVIYCHISVCSWELFVYSVRQVLWIGWLSWRYILGGWALLYCPLIYCYAVCFLNHLLTAISDQWNIISYFLVVINNVTDIYSMCVSGWVSRACSSQKATEQEELEPGKAVHYTWAEPTGSRELCWTCGTYSGKLKSEEVLDLIIFINSMIFSKDILNSYLIKTASVSVLEEVVYVKH